MAIDGPIAQNHHSVGTPLQSLISCFGKKIGTLRLNGWHWIISYIYIVNYTHVLFLVLYCCSFCFHPCNSTLLHWTSLKVKLCLHDSLHCIKYKQYLCIENTCLIHEYFVSNEQRPHPNAHKYFDTITLMILALIF